MQKPDHTRLPTYTHTHMSTHKNMRAYTHTQTLIHTGIHTNICTRTCMLEQIEHKEKTGNEEIVKWLQWLETNKNTETVVDIILKAAGKTDDGDGSEPTNHETSRIFTNTLTDARLACARAHTHTSAQKHICSCHICNRRHCCPRRRSQAQATLLGSATI